MALTEDILLKIKPYVIGWISDAQASKLGTHDLGSRMHTGTLLDSQAPQFLKTDGSRQLLGNLGVAEGITIDGVDISAFRGAYDTHAAATAQAGHAGGLGEHTHQSAGQGGKLDHNLALTGLTTGDPHTQYALRARQISAGAGLSGGGDLSMDRSLSVDTAWSPTWTGNHTFRGSTVTRHLIPEVNDTYDLGSSMRMWRKGWLSEMDAVLFSEQTQTLVGGWLTVGIGEGTLPYNLYSDATQYNFDKAMTTGDFLVLRGALMVEYLQVGSLVSGTTYNITRDLDGSGANTWPAGSVYAIRRDGKRWIELNAYDTPRISMIRQGSSYNIQTEDLRIGDLNGDWGYSAEAWGLALGQYSSGRPNITIDTTNGMRFRLYDQTMMQFNGANADITGKLRLLGTGSALAIGATPPTSSTSGTGLWLDRTGLYSLLSNSYQVKIDASTGDLKFGEGSGTLNTNGMTFTTPESEIGESPSSIKWADASEPYIAAIGTRYTLTSFGLNLYEVGITIKDLGYPSITNRGRFRINADFTRLEGTIEQRIGVIGESSYNTPESGYARTFITTYGDPILRRNDGSGGNFDIPKFVSRLVIPVLQGYFVGAAIGNVSTNSKGVALRYANVDVIYYNIAIPAGWGSRAVACDIWWAPTNTNTGNARLIFEGRNATDGVTLPTSASSAPNVLTQAPGVVGKVKKTTISSLAMGSEGQAMTLALYRNGNDGSDTYTGSVMILAAQLRLV